MINEIEQTQSYIYLVILNIDSFAGLCANATHVYGHLILSENKNVNIDNIEDYNVDYLGKRIELKRKITLDIAKELDMKDGGKAHQIVFNLMQENLEFAKEYPERALTERFDTIKQVADAGIKKWKELNLNCPFISLYKGRKYEANEYESSSTIILYKM